MSEGRYNQHIILASRPQGRIRPQAGNTQQLPQALINLFNGGNKGKQLVALGDSKT